MKAVKFIKASLLQNKLKTFDYWKYNLSEHTPTSIYWATGSDRPCTS